MRVRSLFTIAPAQMLRKEQGHAEEGLMPREKHYIYKLYACQENEILITEESHPASCGPRVEQIQGIHVPRESQGINQPRGQRHKGLCDIAVGVHRLRGRCNSGRGGGGRARLGSHRGG